VTDGWHHVVVNYDGTNSNFYLDGTLVNNVTAGGTIGTGSGTIGLGSAASGGSIWGGGVGGVYNTRAMDEVGIWSRALTGAEVTSLYNGGSGFQYPFSAAAPVNGNFFLMF
jgi:hypothetical protein